ncbi:MAG: hypothetical protein N4A61_01345 [Pelagimonas sp.]|nr:hypothetical protein [Pelagimonas sp.]
MKRMLLVCLALLGTVVAGPGSAGSLFSGATAPLLTSARPLISRPSGDVADGHQSASLFAGTSGNSLLAPPPDRPKGGKRGRNLSRLAPSGLGRDVDAVLSLIARAEAGSKGYNAVHHGARIKPPRAPSEMTINEIYKWFSDTPGQPHAIGRYQFIPKTLRRLVRNQGLPTNSRFSPMIQDQLAHQLLREAGLEAFRKREIGRTTFMRNLAKIWAGLPLKNGKSYYQGYAGNKATMSWSEFSRSMSQIFPGRA